MVFSLFFAKGKKFTLFRALSNDNGISRSAERAEGAAGCLLDVEFRRNSTSGGVINTRKTSNNHTPPCLSEKGGRKLSSCETYPYGESRENIDGFH